MGILKANELWHHFEKKFLHDTNIQTLFQNCNFFCDTTPCLIKNAALLENQTNILIPRHNLQA